MADLDGDGDSSVDRSEVGVANRRSERVFPRARHCTTITDSQSRNEDGDDRDGGDGDGDGGGGGEDDVE